MGNKGVNTHSASGTRRIRVDGKIYVIGGSVKIGEEWQYHSTVEVYDPTSNTWATKADIPTPRDSIVAEEINGKIYVIGGGNAENVNLAIVEEYNPMTNEWNSKTPMPTSRSNMASAVVDGKIYVLGGVKRVDGQWQILSTVEVYDPKADTWDTRADLTTARAAFAAATIGSNIYVMGGIVGFGPFQLTSKVEEFNKQTNQWHSRKDLPAERYGLAAIALSGRIYAIGGRLQELGDNLKTVEEYNPVINQWRSQPEMSTRRRNFSVAVADGKIYAIGGWDDINTLNIVEMLDLIPSGSHMARVLIRIKSTSEHGSLGFYGDETIEEIDIHVLEGEDLIQGEGHYINPEEKTVGYGRDGTTLVSVEFTIELSNLDKDTDISLRQKKGCNGFTKLEIYNSLILHKSQFTSWEVKSGSNPSCTPS